MNQITLKYSELLTITERVNAMVKYGNCPVSSHTTPSGDKLNIVADPIKKNKDVVTVRLSDNELAYLQNLLSDGGDVDVMQEIFDNIDDEEFQTGEFYGIKFNTRDKGNASLWISTVIQTLKEKLNNVQDN